MKRATFFLALASLTFVFLAATDALGQRREHLTKEEIELVRDNQEIDKRMEVFTNAIERRMWVIAGTGKLTEQQLKRIKKDSDKWGELPTGEKSELFSDIGKILNESIDKFEDVYERDPKGEAVTWAFYILADYSEALISRLKAVADLTTDRRELSLLETAATDCQQILKARESIPRPTEKRKKKRKKK